MGPQSQVNSNRRKRTFHIWAFSIGFALLSFWGFVRLVDSALNWYWYTFAGMRPGPWYLVATGGFWGVCGLTALIWLFFFLPYWRQIASGAALLYGLFYWLDRLLAGSLNGGLPESTLPALVTLLCLGYVFFILHPWAGTKTEEMQSDVKK